MKKILALMIVLAISLSLTACGGEEVTLQSQTVNNLTLDVPSDIGEFTDVSDNVKMAYNDDSTAGITISGRVDAQGITADMWDEETYTTTVLSEFGDLQVLEFSTSETVAGSSAVYAHYTGKNSGDVEIDCYNYMLFFDDGTFQSVAFNFTKDADSYLKKNLSQVIESMRVQ